MYKTTQNTMLGTNQIFFHNVGLDGANRDFPKTVFNSISINVVEQSIPPDAIYREEVVQQLHHQFPSGFFNCWGVPAGAESAIKYLNVGDVMLLVKTIGGEHGEIPALGVVNEVQFSEGFSSNYYLYRVYQFDSDTNTGKFYIQAGAVKSVFNLLPIEYRATIL